MHWSALGVTVSNNNYYCLIHFLFLGLLFRFFSFSFSSAQISPPFGSAARGDSPPPPPVGTPLGSNKAIYTCRCSTSRCRDTSSEIHHHSCCPFLEGQMDAVESV